MYQKIDIQEWQKYNLGPLFLNSPPDKFSITNIFGELLLTSIGTYIHILHIDKALSRQNCTFYTYIGALHQPFFVLRNCF